MGSRTWFKTRFLRYRVLEISSRFFFSFLLSFLPSFLPLSLFFFFLSLFIYLFLSFNNIKVIFYMTSTTFYLSRYKDVISKSFKACYSILILKVKAYASTLFRTFFS